jgi:hypothetical protein
MRTKWKFLRRTQTGVSHLRSGGLCQDALRIETINSPEGQCLVFCCSDGAGTAIYGFEGASLVCEKFLEIAHQYCLGCDGVLSSLSRDSGIRWLEEIRSALIEKAHEARVPPRELACTCLAGIISPYTAAFLQVGDGAIVIDQTEVLRVVFWPQSGEYVNSTNFVSDEDASSRMAFDVFGVVNDLAVFTDGLERLLLRWDLKTVHEPAIRPMLNQLAATPEERIRDLEESLGLFLQSEAVISRTDDDTALILATRRVVHASPS